MGTSGSTMSAIGTDRPFEGGFTPPGGGSRIGDTIGLSDYGTPYEYLILLRAVLGDVHSTYVPYAGSVPMAGAAHLRNQK